MTIGVGRREPIFNIPAVIVVLIVALTAVQAGRSLITPDTDLDVVGRLAFVPLRLTALLDPSGVAARLATWMAATDGSDVQRATLADFFLHSPTPAPLTLLSYAALHGNWAHVGLNSLWLLAFGTPVARRFGTPRFLAFLAVTAIAGALAHWVCFPFGAEPVIGASAAVSGCMGAALRFAFRPPQRNESAPPVVAERPLSLMGVVRDRRALSFLLVWFASNALFGAGSTAFGLSDAPVAWQAHVGGFLAGLLLFALFDPRPKDDGMRPAVGSEPVGEESADAP